MDIKYKIKILPYFYTFLIVILIIIYWKSLPKPLFNEPVCLVLDDKDGNLIGAHIASDGQWRFPYNNEIPEKFEKAIIQFEDKRFFSHPGFDIIALSRAFWQNIKANKKISGGSTITMQTIRLYRKGKKRTVFEKIIEIILATRLEIGKSKKEILTIYSSNAPFGGNVVGFDAASWRYFGRSPSQLSWAECAMLAVLPNSPSLIHPGKNRKYLLKKRNNLLKKLENKKIINTETYELAILEPIPEKPKKFPAYAPHLLQRISKMNNNSHKIISTIDLNYQIRANQIIKKHYQKLSGNGINNIAALVVEVETGNSIVYIGNSPCIQNNKNGQQVDIIPAKRSTGSVLKPMLYAGMLTSGELLPYTLIPDIPTQISGYSPKNYNLGYDGAVSAKRALARSLNIPAIRMLQNYGVEKFHFLLQKIGMTTLTEPPCHYGLSLILGGADGSLWDLCGIYASMARSLNHFFKYSGQYTKEDYFPPNIIKKNGTKIKHINNNKLDNSCWLSASAIWLTFNAMIDVERPDAENLWRYFSSSKKIAWKTGTSFGFRDAWAIGITPEYVVGIWVGNADGEGRPDLTGISSAAPVLFDIFNILPKSENWFDQPFDDMELLPTCHESGYIASENCENIDSIWVPKTGLRFYKCPYHKIIHIDKSGKWRVNSNCESVYDMQHKSWFILPPAIEWFYKTRHSNYKSLPSLRSDCLNEPGNINLMEVIYPKDLTKIYIPVELDGTKGKTIFEVAHRKANTTIFWHIDDNYIGRTKDFHQFALNPLTGKHTLTLIDENGEILSFTFEIINNE
ncbi:MAG: penicillin-binding protein 1C [Bacteroidales bacterium]|nr:penicillin-binding protein 1C [Bacteroidales bacterium]